MGISANAIRRIVAGAVTEDSRVLLFDAPELPQQLYTLWQATGTRVADISGIFLTHAHVGHYRGLAYLGKEAIAPIACLFCDVSLNSSQDQWSLESACFRAKHRTGA